MSDNHEVSNFDTHLHPQIPTAIMVKPISVERISK